MPSKDELLQSIHPGMRLDKAFFLRVYGYEISFPGFKELAIRMLEDAGCGKARSYYDEIIGEYQRGRDAEIRPVAADYALECRRGHEKKINGGEGHGTDRRTSYQFAGLPQDW